MTAAHSIPTDTQIALLRESIANAKRKAEYESLKRDLHDITYQAANTPTEFDGQMQRPDTDRVLKTKRTREHWIELLFGRVKGMFSVRPLIGNIIALLIAGIALFYIFNEVNIAGFKAYQNYFAIGIQLFAALQIIKSATRGLLLPFLALVVGGSVAHSLGADQTLLHFNRNFYEHVMLTGIIGLGVAVLAID